MEELTEGEKGQSAKVEDGWTKGVSGTVFEMKTFLGLILVTESPHIVCPNVRTFCLTMLNQNANETSQDSRDNLLRPKEKEKPRGFRERREP